MPLPFYHLENLVKLYGQRVALSVSELSLSTGKIYAIVGPNGAGKTTLLRILALIEPPTSGRLALSGEEIGHNSVELYLRRRRVTLMLQQPLLLKTTVEKNVDYGLRARGLPRGLRKDRVAECLKLVGLEGFGRRRAATLSGGEAQRVAFARAAALRPEAILLDEPTSSVDQASVSFLENLIRRLNQDYGTTVVFATHDLGQAYRVADEVVGLADGKLADLATGNLFAGTIVWWEGECFFDTGRVRVAVIPPPGGSARYLSIAAEDIIISLAPVMTSARNNFVGRITGLQEERHTVIVSVQAGELFRIRITRMSCREMQLNIGCDIHLSFKSSTVKLF